MGRIILILLLALLQLASAGFVRPWENATWLATNPSVWCYGAEVWWDVPELHKTVSGMHAEEAAGLEMDSGVAGFVSKARGNASLAKRDADWCVAGMEVSWGTFPVLPLGSAIAAFSAIPQCLAYRNAWIGSVDNALAALGGSVRIADKAVAGARASRDSMAFAGLCDAGYAGVGSEICPELASAFAAIDNGVSEGRYGKYPLLKEYAAEVAGELAAPTPDLGAYPVIMGLAWGDEGVVRTFTNLTLASEKAKADAETSYQAALRSAKTRRENAGELIAGLASQRLDLIDRAAASFSVGETGTIAERMAGLGRRKLEVDSLFGNAGTLHGTTTERGYLSASIEAMTGADADYEALASAASELEADAEETVGQQEEEASAELERTERQFGDAPPSSDATALLEEARGEYSSAARKGSQGERFYSYGRAAALARSAREGRARSDELAAEASLAEIGALVDAAEKDGINVVSEREELGMLGSLSPYDAAPYLDPMRDAIISKARVKYEDGLLAARARIYSDLSLAGPGAADLYTDAGRCDDGMFDGDALRLPESVGRLAKLKACYATLISELEQYECGIIGNSMSVRASPHLGEVALDAPAEVTLDLVLRSKSGYNCSSVEARVALDSAWPFMYSDIVSGQDGVESVRSEDGGKTLALVLKAVGPEETMRVIFAKTSVLAHILKEERSAEGLGGGVAAVSENTAFELDAAIGRLSVDGEATIDGLDSERPLQPGKHTLSLQRTVDGAYTERTANAKSYRLGINSEVEYDVRIMPAMDLDSVPIALDSMNDSRISSFRAVSATGEEVRDERRISETQYGLALAGLRKGREAVVKVSYIVERADSFVEEELGRLGSLNMSGEAAGLIAQARAEADAGNYSGALALLERSKAAQKEEDGKAARVRREREALAVAVQAELGEINGFLEAANGSNSTLAARIAARRMELERALNESADGSLEKVDMKWLAKELASFGKDAYAGYGALRERFYLSGNASTPQEFVDFETELNRLESGRRLEYAAGALGALERVRARVESQERVRALAAGGMKEAYAGLRGRVEETLDAYSKQAAAARGTEYAGLFQESSKTVEKLLADADAAAGKDPDALMARMAELNRSERRMALTLEALGNESGAKLSLLTRLLAAKPDGKKKDLVHGELEDMRGLADAGDYVAALRAGSAAAKELDGSGWGEAPGGNGIVVLGLTAFAALAAIGVYVVKNGKGEKKLRRLQSSDRPPPGPPTSS